MMTAAGLDMGDSPVGCDERPSLRLFQRALQRVLVLPRGVHHLVLLVFCEFIAEPDAHADDLTKYRKNTQPSLFGLRVELAFKHQPDNIPRSKNVFGHTPLLT